MTLGDAIQNPAESHFMKISMESGIRAIMLQPERCDDHQSDYAERLEV
jgi:hypothetical protein